MKVGVKGLTGAHAVAEAMRQIDPCVVAAYPITPQTPIVERFSEFWADGLVGTELIPVESEHSAMSACVGASAAGARAMTASASAGLALMWEILGVASGLRLPIVMNIVNRALSSPINVHCDHGDSMGARDHGWVQIYSENAEEAYDNTILAVRLAESLENPVMVMQDGFVTSHGVQEVRVLPDNVVKKFVGERKPKRCLFDFKSPVTMGALALPDYYFEIKRQQAEVMNHAKAEYLKVGKELSKLTGREYPTIEPYELSDAGVAIVVLSSTAGTASVVVDELRKEGKKVGLLKISLFRPFPYEEVSEALSNVKLIATMDRSVSFGADPPVFSEVKGSLYGKKDAPGVVSFVYGAGGRDAFKSDIRLVFEKLLSGRVGKYNYVGLREGCEK